MKKLFSLIACSLFAISSFAQVTTNTGGGSSSGGGGSYTASNGIGISGSVIKLGGNLTENTFVGSGNYNLSFNNKTYNNTSQRSNLFSDTIIFTLYGSKYFHHTHVPSVSSVSGTYPNLFLGFKAGNTLAGKGYANTAIGTSSMESMNSDSSAASSNTAIGYQTLKPMVYGLRNVVIGTGAMSGCATGTFGAPITANTAIGHHAYRQGVGNYNIAIGASALEDMTTNVTDIIGIGQNALKVNTASFNIGIGYQAGAATTSGGKNTYIGWGCGQLNTTPTENTHLGYLAGGSGIGTSGYNTYIGSRAGAGTTGGNTNVAVGRESLGSLTTGVGNVAIGNNAAQTGNWSNSIIIGRTINVTASYELNIGGALYGASIYSTTPRFALGKVAGTNSTFDMGGCTLPIILPKTGTTPSVGLESAMLYYNTNTNNIDFYDGSSWNAIQKEQPITTTTSASGISWASSTTPQIVLDASLNAITQTIPSHSSVYKGWVVRFKIIFASVNAVTFSVQSAAVVNGVSGATSFSPANGKVVEVTNDGTQFIITY